MLLARDTLAFFKKSFDGQSIFDMVSSFVWPRLDECEHGEIENSLPE